ncbi:SDR family oxidoreductase [Jiella mangrovi]|uniref:SDR family oxidoreductase n=1 Tax=Jiella mangrovi TaxID=2821407 RepID=A0ABS4BH63_9HYPH|nr:SDR family oxidoreductase [Jiella mangrovi]MBP0616091.1 SDR family oxidoreductase [Jiella mangrovi]
MTDKITALVTGANKGIGFEVARQLGTQGHEVWLGCRNAALGEEAAMSLRDKGIEARAVTLDVTDSASIKAAAARVLDESGKLDVLVNNAGISIGAPPRLSEENIADMQAMFDVNTFGPVRVTQAFLPLLRQAQGARIVMLSSGLGSLADATDMAGLYWNVGFAGYCASKTALNMLTVKLAKELLPEGIKVNAADPGFTATDLNGHTGHRHVGQAAKVVVDLAMLGFMGPTAGFFHDGHAGQSRNRW